MGSNTKLSPQELLDFLAKSGKIDVERLQQDAEMKKKEEFVKEILERDKRKLTLCKDNRWRVRIPLNGKNTVIAKTKYEDIIDYLYSLYYKTEQKVTIAGIYPEWIDYKTLQVARDTSIKRIRTDWNRFYKGDPFTTIPIEELTSLQCETWLLKKLKENKLTKTAYYNMSLIVREVLDYAVRKEIITALSLSIFHLLS